MKKQLLLPIALSLIALPFLQRNDAQTDSLQITIAGKQISPGDFFKNPESFTGGGEHQSF